MELRKAVPADYAEIIDLANLAYRGRDGAVASWNIEKGSSADNGLTIRCSAKNSPQSRMERYSFIARKLMIGCWEQHG